MCVHIVCMDSLCNVHHLSTVFFLISCFLDFQKIKLITHLSHFSIVIILFVYGHVCPLQAPEPSLQFSRYDLSPWHLVNEKC